jgi:hypothetical protein
VLQHYRAKKASESREWSKGVERGAEVRLQQAPHYGSGRSLGIFRSYLRERVVCQPALVHHPIQETVYKTGAMLNQVERPHRLSIIEPLSYGLR